MINGFLNISRLEAGQMYIEKQPFELDHLLREVLAEIKLTARTHSFHLEECAHITVNADRNKISSVISNLVSNAVKYSPKGKLVEIRCQVHDEMVTVSVRDEGIGIMPRDLSHIFECYYRVEANHTRHISGLVSDYI